MNGYNATFTRINRHPRNTFPTQLYSPIYLLPGFQLTLDIAISQLNTTLLVLCTIEQEPLRYLGINITQIYQHIVRVIVPAVFSQFTGTRPIVDMRLVGLHLGCIPWYYLSQLVGCDFTPASN